MLSRSLTFSYACWTMSRSPMATETYVACGPQRSACFCMGCDYCCYSDPSIGGIRRTVLECSAESFTVSVRRQCQIQCSSHAASGPRSLAGPLSNSHAHKVSECSTRMNHNPGAATFEPGIWAVGTPSAHSSRLSCLSFLIVGHA